MVDKNHTMIDKNLQNGKSKDILQVNLKSVSKIKFI